MGNEKPRILCVEDEPECCNMLRVILPKYEIIPAASQAEAVKLAREFKFAIIFMDYWLSDGTGEHACREIRYFDQTTPILFITGSVAFSETKARALGAQGTLKKGSPTFIEELQSRTADLALD